MPAGCCLLGLFSRWAAGVLFCSALLDFVLLENAIFLPTRSGCDTILMENDPLKENKR